MPAKQVLFAALLVGCVVLAGIGLGGCQTAPDRCHKIVASKAAIREDGGYTIRAVAYRRLFALDAVVTDEYRDVYRDVIFGDGAYAIGSIHGNMVVEYRNDGIAAHKAYLVGGKEIARRAMHPVMLDAEIRVIDAAERMACRAGWRF